MGKALTHKLRIVFWLLGLIALLTGILFILQARLFTVPESAGQKLTLSVYKGEVSALVYLALDKGYFRKQGLDVTLMEYEAGKLAVDAMLDGESDVAIAGELVFISKLQRHPDLRIFGTVSDFRIDELLARRDSGIEAPGDLLGKRIGVLQNATSEYFLGQYLSQINLDYQDIDLVYLTPSEIVQSLIRGDIDAAQTWDPNIYHLKWALGSNAVSMLPGTGLEPTETFVLITRASLLNTDSKIAERLLRGLLEAEAFVDGSPMEVIDYMAGRFELDEDYIRYVMPKIRLTVRLPQRLMMAMEHETRWAIDNGLVSLNSVPDYLEYFELAPLQSVKPDSVTIIK